MFKIYKIVILLFLTSFSFSSNAHVKHYQNLNEIEFDIYRNNKLIGKHIFTFNRDADKLFVKSNINFQIKKLGIVLYKYNAELEQLQREKKMQKTVKLIFYKF